VRNKLTNLGDTELALLAKKGNRSAFEVIYDRHASGVARVLASFAGTDRDILDDLTQDVFMKVIDKISSYVPSHPFARWLYTIALNTGRNHVRRQSKIVQLESSRFDANEARQDPEAKLSREILADTLMRLVSRLPERLREVVSLRIGNDLPYGDIAAILDIPEGTARSRMHTALNLLKQNVGLNESNKETK
jgi:RNA polymerase sigma-70 factor (ECF subfamily)